MAYYKELPGKIQDEIYDILHEKAEKLYDDSEHGDKYTFINDIIDNWLNIHNRDLSNRDWLEQTDHAEL